MFVPGNVSTLVRVLLGVTEAVRGVGSLAVRGLLSHTEAKMPERTA